MSSYSSTFTLWSCPYSSRAMMVRLMLAMKGPPKNGRPDMQIRTENISISPQNPEQLSEHYVCNVNAKGQVPVLVNSELLGKPMAGTVDISNYICDWYPNLLPSRHAEVIKRLVHDLHDINFSLLTFGLGSNRPENLLLERIGKQIEESDMSEEYRNALISKAAAIKHGLEVVTEDNFLEHGSRTRRLCTDVLDLRRSNNQGGNHSSYIFGSSPTMLDAHMLVWLCRLVDLQKLESIPSELLGWVEEFRASDVWKQVVPNGSTMPPFAPRSK